MSAELNLPETYDKIQSEKITERSAGLSDLKRILSHSNNAKGLNDKGYHRMYEAIFRAAIKEKALYVRQQKASLKKTIAGRLSSCGAVFRSAVELGVRHIKNKTFKAVYKHIIDILPEADQGLCEPLSLNYVKALRVCLEHAPHLEHLSMDEWETLARFCCSHLGFQLGIVGEADQEQAVTVPSTPQGPLTASRRSLSLSQSQGNTRLGYDSEELMLCLQLLLGSPNAPIVEHCQMTCTTALGFLTSQPTVTRAHQPAFSSLNSILDVVTTNNIDLSSRIAEDIVPVIGRLWDTKSPELKEKMIITLIYCHPHLRAIIRDSGSNTLRRKIEALSEVLFSEYSERADRDQLQLDDLVFPTPCMRLESETTLLGLRAFCLRKSIPFKAERNWAMPYLMAGMTEMLDQPTKEDKEVDADGNFDMETRTKRRRVSQYFDEILRTASRAIIPKKLCALQMLPFLLAGREMDGEEFSSILTVLYNACSDENPIISSWAMLSIASCAFLSPASDTSHSSFWQQTWQLCVRYVASQPTCRVSCHLMRVILSLDLIPYSRISSTVDDMIRSIDLSGPATLADSALAVWCLILEKRNTVAHSSLLQPGERLVQWLISKWKPVEGLERLNALFYAQNADPLGVVNFLFSCCGKKTININSYINQTFGPIGQTGIRVARYGKLVNFLLLDDSEQETQDLDELSLNINVGESLQISGRNAGVELQVVEFLDKQADIVHEKWQTMASAQFQQITSDMIYNFVGFLCIGSMFSSSPTLQNDAKAKKLQEKLAIIAFDVTTYLNRDDCKHAQLDGLLNCVSGIIPKVSNIIESIYNPPGLFSGIYGQVLYRISTALETKIKNADSIDVSEYDDDMMDIDDGFGVSERDKSSGKEDAGLARGELQAICSLETYRNCAIALLTLFAYSIKLQEPHALCGAFTAYLMKLSKPRLIMSRPIVREFLSAASEKIGDTDAANLTEHLAIELLQGYDLERCESSMELCIDALHALVSRWASEGQRGDLATNCESIYDWAAKVSLEKRVTSHRIRMSMARLLQKMLEVDAEYKSGAISARTQFIQLLADEDVRVGFLMAHCVPVIFKLFGLVAHPMIFLDIYEKLTNNAEWAEGLAVRVYTLAQLAATDFSAKKLIVYHIFETAQLVLGEEYSARALLSVAKTLNLASHRDLFKIFSSQSLFTWLENDDLRRFPFRGFGYANLKELCADVQEELVAQLMMRGKDEVSENLASILGITYAELLEKGFHKIIAYGVAWEIATPPKSGGVRSASVEVRVRRRLGDEEYAQLMENNFALIISNLFLLMQEDGTSEKLLSRDPALSAASGVMEKITDIGFSETKLAEPLRPYYRVKVILNGVHHVCSKMGYDDFKLWSPAMFTFVVRRLFDSMDPALGPLHACAVVRKIRLLVCLAGSIVHEGYALEMVIHGLKPFLVDKFCAEDTVGVIQYLLIKGQNYLCSQPAFVTGTFLSILASLRNFLSPTTNSQQPDTQLHASLSAAQSFHTWLGKHLTSYRFRELSDQQNHTFQAIVTSAMGFRSHGNASSGTMESDLLRHLLDDERNQNRLLDDVSRRLAFALLGSNFERPESFRADMFGNDADSIERSKLLFRTCRRYDVSHGFLLWSARVLGRSYAASGVVYNEWTQEIELEEVTNLSTANYGLDIIPKAGILQRIRSLLLSDDRLVVSLAEDTLEVVYFEEVQSPEDPSFNIIFDKPFHMAMHWIVLPIPSTKPENPRPIMSVEKPDVLPVDTWVKNLAMAISTNLQDAVVANIRPVLEKVDGLAGDLFPFIVHVLLISKFGPNCRLRAELSQLFRDCFRTCTEKTVPHTMILIKSILYLRTQEIPGEVTKASRDKWLNVDYLELSSAASTCKMFKTALLFAEVHHSQTNTKFINSDLLLQIFKNIDDPDSYYGVTQSSSLESVLNQFEYEEDAWKSISFRGANLESHMRLGSISDQEDIVGVVDAFNNLGMNGLSHYFLQSDTAASASETTLDNMFRSAWKLEQWDLPCPATVGSRSAVIYRAFQSVNKNVGTRPISSYMDSPFLEVMQQITAKKQTGHSLGECMRSLAILTEMEEILGSKDIQQLEGVWDRLQSRTSWMHIGRYSDVEEIMAMRQAAFGSLAKRQHLRDLAQVDSKTAKFMEARALVGTCKMARSHKVLQHSLSAATHLSKIVAPCRDANLNINAVVTLQAANVLWDQGQGIPAIRMLQALQSDKSLSQQSIPVGVAKLLAKLGNWVSDARLEKPDKIMTKYLETAIAQLKKNIHTKEAGRVFHEFASFCDQQLQNPNNIEDYERALKLRQNKEAEVRELEALQQKDSKVKAEIVKAKAWLRLDDAEFNRLKENREAFLEKSIGNYLRALGACDDYNNDAVRFCALWLANSENPKVNNAAKLPLELVTSQKFVPLMNQLSSRLLDNEEDFQHLLFPLIARICVDHPFHGMYHILALTRANVGDSASILRISSAMKIAAILGSDQKASKIWRSLADSTTAYISLAEHNDMKKDNQPNSTLQSALPPALYKAFEVNIPSYAIPPPTMHIEVRADGDYSKVPVLQKFHPGISLASGLSAPKIITCLASDGKNYKLLVKGGNDDLRQDAIMEQVFEQVSNLLQKSRATRQRNLRIRTYKVLPLKMSAGIIEFVPNTIPFNDFLLPAHDTYHPKDWKHSQCRRVLGDVQNRSRETRVEMFQKVMRHFSPVMRYFFMHRFNGPDEWFSSRLAYSRSTAAISILGHVLGLGDRHGHNILLDKKSGEVVHIDLGVAFEQGRILPIPEVVPFRLTRDIVDGMGITKTEGVFRRCCEFTLTVLRNESYNIITILDVLRYDPLYSWNISPLRMGKIQKDEVESRQSRSTTAVRRVSKPQESPEHESKADHALTVVAKKLSKTLSVGATVNELIQQASDERNLAVLFVGWAAYL